MGRDKLIMPGGLSSEPPPPVLETPKEKEHLNGGGGGPTTPSRHPFIEGLLKTLPEPETEWKTADRVKWLQTAANIFDLIYKGDGGGISVTIARADRSPRPGEN